MKIIYTFVKLKVKEKHSCEFCKSAATYLLRASDTEIGKSIAINYLCENCKERFNNNQIIKCADCGRLKKTLTEKCLCVFLKENNVSLDSSDDSSDDDYEQIELEKQINTLSKEKKQLTEEVETHLEALEISEVWNKRQKQELLDKIDKLEEENKRLKEQNKKIVPEKLANKIETYEKEIGILQKQLEQANNQLAQIEVPPKENKIKGFFKFGSSSK